jgi:hypothetical protein
VLTKTDKVAVSFLAFCLLPVLTLALLSEILSGIRDAWIRKTNDLCNKAGW